MIWVSIDFHGTKSGKVKVIYLLKAAKGAFPPANPPHCKYSFVHMYKIHYKRHKTLFFLNQTKLGHRFLTSNYAEAI